MAIEITVPDIGTDEVEVTEIMVKVGDSVEQEQPLITVEGDKASMEVPASQAGVVQSINIAVGDKVKTGSLIMLFADADNASAPEVVPQSPVASASAASSEREIVVPDIGSDEVEVTEVMVKVGDQVSVEQSLITVEGDKASMEVPAPVAGTVQALTIAVGDKVKTGSPIMVFSVTATVPVAAPATGSSTSAITTTVTSTAQSVSSAPVAVKNTQAGDFAENGTYIHATPLIRRLAREFGVNLAKIKGSGRKGRILREDVQNYIKQALQVSETTASGGTLPGLLPWPNVDFNKFGATEEIELGRIQKISGANLHRNWVMIPHVTQFDDADITDLEAFRKQQNQEAEKKKLEVKITPLVFIMKAVAKALQEMPRFNSSLSADAQRLTLKKYIHIGVAVDTPNGLVVPVFRDVDKKGIIDLSRELAEVSKKARSGKLTSGDMQGGCFTISSLGGIGGTAFTPIVNAPEVAILGVSKSSIKPVWNGKEFVPRLMLPLSLSYDHRVIDGADGARFISLLGAVLSDLRRLIM